MSDSATKGKGSNKWIFTLIRWGVYCAFLLLLFLFFQPVFVWNLGWKELPDFELALTAEEVFEPGYETSIKVAHKELIKAWHQRRAPAFSVAVGVNGSIVWAEAVCYSNIDENSPAFTNSQFRIGSTSKAVTSLAVAYLMEANRLDIDRRIMNYVSSLPSHFGGVSTRHLLSHMAGIRNYGRCVCFPIWEFHSTRQYNNVRETIDIFANDALMFESGEQFSYTSYGYNLVALVISEIADEPFLEVMQKHVFDPLKMAHTSADLKKRDMQQRVVSYDVQNGKYKPAFEVNNSNKWAGGGFVYTPKDLVKMGNALINDKFVGENIVNQMFTPQTLNNGDINSDGYALGCRVGRTEAIVDSESLLIVHHGGVAMGSMSFLLLLPKENVVISVVANRSRLEEEAFPMAEYAFDIVRPFVEARFLQLSQKETSNNLTSENTQ